MLKYVETKNAPAAIGPYSQGIILNGIAFFSGQIPLSPETGEVVGTTIEEQTEQVMKNIRALNSLMLSRRHASLQIWVISLHLTKCTQSISQASRRAPALQ